MNTQAHTTPTNSLPGKDKENPFISLLFNIALPSLILMKMSEPERLGQQWAFIVALAFPLGFGIWEFARAKKYSFFAIVGFMNVLLTGGLGLMAVDGFWFAVKEASVPLVFGAAVLISNQTQKPLVKTLLYNDKVMQIDRVRAALDQHGTALAFDRLLLRVSYIFAASFLLSAVLNFGLAIYLLKSPGGTPEFNAELGQMQMLSFPVIALPSMLVTMFALYLLVTGIKRLTHLSLEDVLKT